MLHEFIQATATNGRPVDSPGARLVQDSSCSNSSKEVAGKAPRQLIVETKIVGLSNRSSL